MKRFIIAVICLLSLPVLASSPPPEPPGMVWQPPIPCGDTEYPTEKGLCVIGYTPDGTIYLAFWQRGELTFIRRIKPEGGYEQIWTRPGYAAI